MAVKQKSTRVVSDKLLEKVINFLLPKRKRTKRRSRKTVRKPIREPSQAQATWYPVKQSEPYAPPYDQKVALSILEDAKKAIEGKKIPEGDQKVLDMIATNPDKNYLILDKSNRQKKAEIDASELQQITDAVDYANKSKRKKDEKRKQRGAAQVAPPSRPSTPQGRPSTPPGPTISTPQSTPDLHRTPPPTP